MMPSSSQQRDFDAIVIGSGISGGWAAKELTELGLRTLVLEAGRPIDPERDYSEHRASFQMRYRGLGNRRLVEARQQVQRRSVTFDELSHQFWTDDLDNPYTTSNERPFDWLRARQVGEVDHLGRQVYRMGDLDFEANLRDGVAVDWPIRYAEIAPWYDRVERFIGVSGMAEGLAHLPDMQFLPPMPFNVAEQHVRERIADRFKGERLMTIGRVAVVTQRHLGRSACHYCGPCHRGCVSKSYFSSLNSTLPAAEATGRLTLRPWSVVRSLTYDPQRRRISAVQVVDAQSGAEVEFTGRVVFLCASAIESARILLNSASPAFPNGLANGSDQVGRNIMDHIKWGGASGDFEQWGDRRIVGSRPNGIYVPRFRNIGTTHAAFIRGYASRRRGARWLGRIAPSSRDRRRLQGQPNETRPVAHDFCRLREMLPNPRNRATIHRRSGTAGDPVAAHRGAVGENELAIHRDMGVTASELLEAAGATKHSAAHRRPEHRGQCQPQARGCAHGARPRRLKTPPPHNEVDIPTRLQTDGRMTS
ncbi:MAG: GMC family oxidoreductase [Gemmatimonadetes bacterium]|nr:GMC family oxidoreductase [Gemmatimonadota bacterium]